MPIKTSAELFGDDGANGTRAPIDLTPGPGLGPENRAVAFGEGLTSATANRIAYALALNDDDLDGRIREFETGGLDTVYRLGEQDIAGGGRIIQVDGGAVEAVGAMDANYSADKANACFRARIEGATLDGSTGYDFVARAGGPGDTDPGRGGWGFVDRRAMVFTGPLTQLAYTEEGTLNPSGVGVSFLGVDGVEAFFRTDDGTALLSGVDMLEVLDSVYAGLYVINGTANADRVPLVRLDGSLPNFSANVPVTFRVYRPVFVTGGGRIGTSPTHGARFVAMPGDADFGPALALYQPSPTGLVVGGYDKNLVRVFSVDGAGVVRASGALHAAAVQVAGLIQGDSAIITNNLQAGSLNVDGNASMNGLSAQVAQVGALTSQTSVTAEAFITPEGELSKFDGNLDTDLNVTGKGTFTDEVVAPSFRRAPVREYTRLVLPASQSLGLQAYGPNSRAWVPLASQFGAIRGWDGTSIFFPLLPWVGVGSVIRKIVLRVGRVLASVAENDGIRADIGYLNFFLTSPWQYTSYGVYAYDNGAAEQQNMTLERNDGTPLHAGSTGSALLRVRTSLNVGQLPAGDQLYHFIIYCED